MEIEEQIPHWIVDTDTIRTTTADGTVKEKKKYYWKINNPGEIYLPRYFPVRLDGVWYFLPQRYWYSRDDKSFKPFYAKTTITGARTPDGHTVELYAGNKGEVIALLVKGQRNFPAGEKGQEGGLGAGGVVGEYTSGIGRDNEHYVTFDKESGVDQNDRYVRIRDNDVKLMLTEGGRDQPDEIYMKSTLIEGLIAGNKDLNRHRFEIRTIDGSGRIFEMDPKLCITTAEWTLRRDRAINSTDTKGGWNRMINPQLKLYLVPVSPQWEDDFVKIVEDVMTEGASNSTRCLQTVEVLTVKAMETHPERPFTKLATSPFNQYETWITTAVHQNYELEREVRNMPVTADTLSKLGAIVDSTAENMTAGAQRSVVRRAFDNGKSDQISTCVTANKIATARGTRGQTLSQQAVMGGISASDIAVKLGWTGARERVPLAGPWPATGAYAAEWLHRCGFSWGGLGNAGNIHSSQLRENLVFGTSECNSLMTRFEKSWQRLVILQTEIDGGELSTWQLKSRTTRCAAEGDDHVSVRWMCTKIEYELLMGGRASLLGTTDGRLATDFYPFQRGFFTLFEQRIDAAILNKAYKDATTWEPPDIHEEDEVTIEEIGKLKDDGSMETEHDGSMETEHITFPNNISDKSTFFTNNAAKQERIFNTKPSTSNLGGQMPGGNLFHSNPNTLGTFSYNPTAQQKPFLNMGGPGTPGNLTPSQQQQNQTNVNPSTQENQYGNLGGNPFGKYSNLAFNQSGSLFSSQNSFPLRGNSGENSNNGQSSLPGSLSSLNSLSFLGRTVIQPFSPGPPASQSKIGQQAADGTKGCDAETQAFPLNSMFLSFAPETLQRTPPSTPTEHVAKAPFKLFGIIPTELHMLQTPSSTSGIHQRVTLPGTLSLGTLLPSLAGSPIDAIMLLDTTLTYRSKRTRTVPAGLTLATTILLSGFLDPVKTVLRDVFHQEKPRIEVSGLISTEQDCLKSVPAPSGFTLRGVLPEVNINLFGVLDLTELGVRIMGRRKCSAGGYDYAYGFDGRGRIADIDLDFSMTKHRNNYQVFLAMKGDIWKNVGGLVGVDLENVQFEASWQGTNISSVELELQATFNLRTASLLLRGLYSKTNYELAGTLHDADLTMLQHLYEDIFDTTITSTTEHTITFSTLSFLISKTSGITLTGAVTVNGHTSANATIALSTAGIHISGGVEAVVIPGGHVTVESASLDLTIEREKFNVKLAGCVTVNDMNFEVSLYLNKTSGDKLEYTLYGKYMGNLYLRNIVNEVEGSFLDVSLQKVALIISNMDTPAAQMTENVFAYPVEKGLQIFAEATRVDAVNQLLRVEDTKPLQLCAFYNPGSKLVASSFGVSFRLPTTDLITFDCMRSGPLTLKLFVANNSAHIAVTADIYIAVANRQDPLTLQMSLDVNETGALGNAHMIDMWENPFDMSPDVSIGDIQLGVGIQYATFFTTGTPSSLTFGGKFALGDTTGRMVLHLTNNPSQQLISIGFENLDVAALVQLLAKLVGCHLTFSHGSDTMFFRVLTVYLSTGVVLCGANYPAGVRFDADMTIFGKEAIMHAELTREKVAMKGHIEGFKLGDLVVSGVTGSNPSIDIEFSNSVQRVRIDGAVRIGASQMLVDVHVEYAPAQMFYFYVQVKFVDAIKLELKATLDDALSKNVDGQEFTLYATMEQNLVDYIVDIANDHLINQGKMNRTNDLHSDMVNAKAVFDMVSLMFDTRKIQCDDAIRDVADEQAMKRMLIYEKLEAAKAKLQAFLVALDIEVREFTARIERELSQNEEEERVRTAVLTAAVDCLIVEELDLKRVAMLVSERESRLAAAMEAMQSATDNLERFEKKCEEDLAYEPVTTDPAHTVWEWARRELMRQLDLKRVAAHVADADHAAALAAFKPSDALKVTQDQLALTESMTAAVAALTTHGATSKAARAAIEQAVTEDLQRLTTKAESEQAVLEASVESLQREDSDAAATGELLVNAAYTANNIEATPEYTLMAETRKAYEEAAMSSRSFDNLVHISNVWGPLETEPLQYVLKYFAQELLGIKRVTVTGKWGTTSKNKTLNAKIDAVISCISVTLDLNFEIDDVLSFFTSLWMEIGKVMDGVAGTLNDILTVGRMVIQDVRKNMSEGVHFALKEGMKYVDVMDKALEEVGHVLDKVVETGGEVVQVVGEVLNEVIDDVEEFAEDVGHALDKVVETGGEVVQVVGEVLNEAIDDVEEFAEDVGHVVSNVVETGGDVVQVVGEVLNEAIDDVEEFAEDVGHVVSNVVETGGEVVEVVGEVLNGAIDDVEEFAEDVGHAVEGVANDVVHTLDDAAHHVADEVEHAMEEVAHAMEDTLVDVGQALGSLFSW